MLPRDPTGTARSLMWLTFVTQQDTAGLKALMVEQDPAAGDLAALMLAARRNPAARAQAIQLVDPEPAPGTPYIAHMRAQGRAGIGDHEGALRLLQQSLEQREFNLPLSYGSPAFDLTPEGLKRTEAADTDTVHASSAVPAWVSGRTVLAARGRVAGPRPRGAHRAADIRQGAPHAFAARAGVEIPSDADAERRLERLVLRHLVTARWGASGYYRLNAILDPAVAQAVGAFDLTATSSRRAAPERRPILTRAAVWRRGRAAVSCCPDRGV